MFSPHVRHFNVVMAKETDPVKINNVKLQEFPVRSRRGGIAVHQRRSSKRMAVVPIVSGDIDSLVMCKILNNERQEQHPIFIDFGQISSDEEWQACRNVFERCNLPPPERIDLSGYCRSIESGVHGDCKASYINAFLPGRNLMSLMAAASFAYQRGIKIIAIALLSDESRRFPDQTEEFIVNANFAINSASVTSSPYSPPSLTSENPTSSTQPNGTASP